MTGVEYANMMRVLRCMADDIHAIRVLLQSDASQKARVTLLEEEMGMERKYPRAAPTRGATEGEPRG